MGRARRDGARETGPAIETHCRFIIWLVPVLDGFREAKGSSFANGSRASRCVCRIP